MSIIKEHFIDISGRTLFALEAGVEQSTVIFEAGSGDFSAIWHSVQKQVATITTTLSYDRAGLGQSDFATNGRALEECVADLLKLIEATKVQTPVILVGHSFGGFVIRLFAKYFPDKVAGLIFIDSPQEDFFFEAQKLYKTLELPERSFDEPFGTSLSRFFKTQFSHVEYPKNTGNDEGIDLAACKQQVRQATDFGDIPITVISAGHHDMYRSLGAADSLIDFDIHLEQLWFEGQKRLLKLSTNAKQVIADNSRHYVHNDEPQIVIDAILEIIEQVAGKSNKI